MTTPSPTTHQRPNLEPDPAWSTSPSHAALVTLSNGAQLETRVAGPPRTDPITQPLIIIEHGLGGSLYEFVPTVRHIAAFARVLSYNRAGWCRSTLPITTTTTATPTTDSDAESTADANIATDTTTHNPRTITHFISDLHNLLHLTGLPPPYVLLGHSYGGNIARAFLHTYPSSVHGLVLLDSYCVYEPAFDDALIGKLLGAPGGDPVDQYADVVGLMEHAVFTAEEAKELQEMSEREGNGVAAGAETAGFVESVEIVNEWQGLRRVAQDGDANTENGQREWEFAQPELQTGRLSVLSGNTTSDFGKLLANAREKGYGTKEERERFERWLGVWSRSERGSKAAAVSLAVEGKGRFVVAEGLGATHNLQYVAPELIAREVRWVLGMEGEDEDSGAAGV